MADEKKPTPPKSPPSKPPAQPIKVDPKSTARPRHLRENDQTRKNKG
jgi:hypothetical protein